MKTIVDFYIHNLITSDKYNSPNPVRDESLLLPDFLHKVKEGIKEFNIRYPDVEVMFVETYRSNTLQLTHYKNGASKISKNGMHHYGIAVDCAFKINGVFTYNGDYTTLRACFAKQNLYLLGEWDKGHVQYIPVANQGTLRLAVVNSIKTFQKENGLTADGIIGSKTIAKAKEKFPAEAVNGIDNENGTPDNA